VKARWSFLMALAMVVLASGLAFAQDDDATDDDAADDDAADDDAADDDDADAFTAELAFTQPEALEADTTYDFSFEVMNTTTPGDVQRWIYQVDMFMPSADYALNEEDLSAPDALHDGEWSVEVREDSEGIPGLRWEYMGVSSSESYGDIREGETLAFAFQATSDGVPTDGFDWRVIADSEEQVTGTAYINEPPDDDDTDDDADDDVSGDDDDDDDDSGGCGC
jgi:hypothetical protein